MIVLVFSSFLFYLTTSNRCDFYLKKVSGGGEDIFKLLNTTTSLFATVDQPRLWSITAWHWQRK